MKPNVADLEINLSNLNSVEKVMRHNPENRDLSSSLLQDPIQMEKKDTNTEHTRSFLIDC